MLSCVLDVASLEADKWGWTVCLNDFLIDAGMADSLEEAKIEAVLVFTNAMKGGSPFQPPGSATQRIVEAGLAL